MGAGSNTRVSAMTDDVADYRAWPLKGERVSIPSPHFARAAVGHDAIVAAIIDVVRTRTPRYWPLASFCGALALWSAPALLIDRYRSDDLLNALAKACLHPTGGDLLGLFAGLAYVVATGLPVASTMERVAPRRGLYRALLGIGVAPVLVLSLIATFIGTLALGSAILLRCFPALM